MATDKYDESKTRNPAFKADLDVKIIKGLSLAKVPAGYAPDGKLVFEANPKKDTFRFDCMLKNRNLGESDAGI